MNLGIVVYSQTGNTRSVALKLQEALSAAGHRVRVDEVKLAEERRQGARAFSLGSPPSVDGLDALVLGAPVEAFSLSPVMAAYLRGVPSLERARVACLVTQGLPYRWLGGIRALRQMRKLCEAKGATVLGGDVVTWMGAGLDGRIARAVGRLGDLLQLAETGHRG
jgi:hypothetical protein